MHLKLYPQGNQTVRPTDIEAVRTGTDMVETADVTDTTALKYGSIVNLIERQTVNLAAATQTLTAAMCGQKFVGALDAVFTLPAAAAATKGVWYEFETGVASAGTGISISPNASDNVRGNNLATDDNKDLINSGASDVVGDMVRIYCDGVDGWVIEKIIGTWAKE
jgi:hypothetical protein